MTVTRNFAEFFPNLKGCRYRLASAADEPFGGGPCVARPDVCRLTTSCVGPHLVWANLYPCISPHGISTAGIGADGLKTSLRS